ncbi:MAG: phosphatase PAP2 family protein [Bacilli bacterium]|nr:phosphatase PAP2 family protein [Bacilli bacterium]
MMLLDRKNPIHLRETLIVFALILVLFVLGNIFDFKIAEGIHAIEGATPFEVTMSAIAELPVIAALGIGGCFCIKGRPHNCHKFWTVFMVIAGIAGIIAAAYFCFDTFKYIYRFEHLSNLDPRSPNFNNPVVIIVAAIVTILMLVGLFFFYKKLTPKFDKRTMLIIGFFFLLMSLVVAIFATGFKYLWSRPRPLYVFRESDPTSAFRYLYQLNPLYALKADIGDNFKSFPSGHTTYASLGMTLLPLLTLVSDKQKDNRKLQIALFYVGLVWTLLVALSRMLAEAHFLSDVSGAILIAFVVVTILRTVLFKLKSKKETALA